MTFQNNFIIQNFCIVDILQIIPYHFQIFNFRLIFQLLHLPYANIKLLFNDHLIINIFTFTNLKCCISQIIQCYPLHGNL